MHQVYPKSQKELEDSSEKTFVIPQAEIWRFKPITSEQFALEIDDKALHTHENPLLKGRPKGESPLHPLVKTLSQNGPGQIHSQRRKKANKTDRRNSKEQ